MVKRTEPAENNEEEFVVKQAPLRFFFFFAQVANCIRKIKVKKKKKHNE